MASVLVSAKGVLIDSDVLIWLMRGNTAAIAAINTLSAKRDWYISAVSYMELAQGCRNRIELKSVQKAFKSGANDVLPITQGISEMACSLVEKYSLSHSVHLADALIAATAMQHGQPLLSGNSKHFSAIEGLELRIFKP